MQIGSNGFLQPTLLILRLETDESSVGSVNLLSWFTIRSKWIIIESVQIWMGFNTQSYWSLLVRFNESDELIHNSNVCLSNQSEIEWFLTIHYAGNCKLTNFHSVLVLVSQKFIGEEMQCWCVCVLYASVWLSVLPGCLPPLFTEMVVISFLCYKPRLANHMLILVFVFYYAFQLCTL